MNIDELKVGDVIDVKSKIDCVKKTMELAKHGIETDFLYVHKRRQGLWLIVTGVNALYDELEKSEDDGK